MSARVPMYETRTKDVLAYLKRHGESMSTPIGEAVGLFPFEIRTLLQKMERDGFISSTRRWVKDTKYWGKSPKQKRIFWRIANENSTD